jgi:hypothetical protein
MSEPPWPDDQYRLRPPRPSHHGGQDAYVLPDPGQRGRGADGREPWPAESSPEADSGPRGSAVRSPSSTASRQTSRHQRHPPSPGVRLRRWGTLRGRTGVLLVIGSAALGAVITAVSGSQPGFVLGFLVVTGTVAAALAVQPRAAHVIIPVPALAYLVAAVPAGMVSDRAASSSGTALAINAGQWVASGFVAMTLATVLAIIIAVARRVRLHLAGHGEAPQAVGGSSRERGPVPAPADPSRPRG